MKQGYKVRVERDGEGWWVASVPSVRGCHTQAKTLAQVRQRIREALSLFVADAESADIEFRYALPDDAMALLSEQKLARTRAERERTMAARTQRRAALRLRKLGLTVRDAGDLMGLSHQRVQQLLG